MPKFITRLSRGEKCSVHADGSSERDFLYVSDVAEAFDCLLHKGHTGHFYNIGANKGVTIIELAKTLVRFMKGVSADKEDDFIEFVPGRVLDDKRYKIDSSLIKALGWTQKVSFEEGLAKTIEWYTSHPGYWPNSDHALAPHPGAVSYE